MILLNIVILARIFHTFVTVIGVELSDPLCGLKQNRPFREGEQTMFRVIARLSLLESFGKSQVFPLLFWGGFA